jgi:hypothetical protein
MKREIRRIGETEVEELKIIYNSHELLLYIVFSSLLVCLY